MFSQQKKTLRVKNNMVEFNGLREYLELLKRTGYESVSIDGLLAVVYEDDAREPSPYVKKEFHKKTKEDIKKEVAETMLPPPPAPPSPPAKQLPTEPFDKPAWAHGRVKRASGLVEDVCVHGVGHPNPQSLEVLEAQGLKGFGIHGCDGCCHNEERKE